MIDLLILNEILRIEYTHHLRSSFSNAKRFIGWYKRGLGIEESLLLIEMSVITSRIRTCINHNLLMQEQESNVSYCG